MYSEARADFQKAKELDPTNAEAQKFLETSKQKEKTARKRDYYAILGVDRNASEQEIKKAYKRLAIKYHPDRNGQSEATKKMAEKKFIDVNDAYSVLSDPKKKQMYDQGYDPNDPESGGSGGMGGFAGAQDIFNMFFGGGGFNMEDMFRSGGTTFSFGGSQGRGRSRAHGFPGGFEFHFG